MILTYVNTALIAGHFVAYIAKAKTGRAIMKMVVKRVMQEGMKNVNAGSSSGRGSGSRSS